MAAVAFNISKGREVEFYNRVVTNDPANSALIMLVLATGGDTLLDLQDYDTVAALLAGPSNEVTNAGYARKVLTNADLDPWAPDDANNRTNLYLPIQTFVGIAAGSVWDIGVVAYDNDTTGGTDANLIPISAQELRIDGTTIPGTGDDIIWDASNGWVDAV